MSVRDAWPLIGAVVAAGIPAALVAAWRAMPPPRPRLAAGRLFALFGVPYAALLVAFDRVGPAVPLLLAGLAWGFFGGGRGARAAYRFLYGGAWLEGHPDAPRHGARRWHLPLLFGAVACFVAAMLLGR